MSDSGHVQLKLPAKAENVALVRQAVSGLAEALSVEPSVLADMKTAVTEACNNVVLHAYPESVGTMEVEADPNDDHVAILVRDHGSGMQPKSVQPDEPSLGLGLPLIAALSDRFEIRGGSNRGIEVRMSFLLVDADVSDAGNGEGTVKAPEPPTDDSFRAAGVAITPGPMLAPVLGRMTAMLAARADFSLDRLSDAVLIMDAISANVNRFIVAGEASVMFQDGDHKIDLRVGPLVEGGGQQLVKSMELPGLDRSLEQLADELKVESIEQSETARDPGEYLFVRLSSRT